MNRRWQVVTIAVLLSVSFSACMHGLMMRGHGAPEDPPRSPVRYEVSSGSLRLMIDIPPVAQDSEGSIRFTIDGTIPGSVPRMIVWSVRASGGEDHDGHRSKTSSHGALSVDGTTTLENDSGIARITPVAAGAHILTATLASEGDTLRAVVPFEVHSPHGGSMMGMGGGWSATVAVVVVMGGMMLAMWALRGGW